MNFQRINLKKKWPAWLDFLEGLTGGLLACFIGIHLIFDGTILFGTEVFNAIPGFLHHKAIAILTAIAIVIIVCLLLTHFVLAWRKIPIKYAEISTFRNLRKMLKHKGTWAWGMQCITGMLVLLFAVMHMWTVLTAPEISADQSIERAMHIYYDIYYFIFMLAVVAHVAIGLYRLLIKWGSYKTVGRKVAFVVMTFLFCFYVALSSCAIVKFHKLGNEKKANQTIESVEQTVDAAAIEIEADDTADVQ